VNGTVGESHFKQETGRDHGRPSVVLAADVGAALERQQTQNVTRRKKLLQKAALESRVTFAAALLIAGSPLASIVFVAAREETAPQIAEVGVGTFFLVAMMVMMPKALPPLNQTVPRLLGKVEVVVGRINASLKGKERGEEVKSSKHLGIGRDLRNMHAAVGIVKVMRLYAPLLLLSRCCPCHPLTLLFTFSSRRYIVNMQRRTNSLAFLGSAVTLLVIAIAAVQIVVNPTFGAIASSQVTLVCLCYGAFGVGYLVTSVNLCIRINNELTTVQARIFNDLARTFSEKLAFDGPDDATRARLVTTRDLCENLRDDALHFPNPMKVLTVPVTKELRAKLFGLLLSMALSMIVRLVQSYLM
jgi:hypothetical protein